MGEDRFNQALARIEAATDTLAAHLARRADRGDPSLAARYDQLRAATALAIARLDRLIGLAEEPAD